MLRAMTATWSLITTSFASDADGYRTSRYPRWTSFWRVEPASDSSHCCAVRWKLRLSAGGANLPRSEMRAQHPHYTSVRPLDESTEKRQGLQKEETNEESL